MLIAQTDNQELIIAHHTLDKQQPYYCPSCQSPVHLKQGPIIRPHFAHFQNDACEVFAEGETLEHIEGKWQLAEWLKNLNLQVEIEAYLPELKQRPDVLVHIEHKQIAIEFQCSSIPIEKVVERTEGYLNAGYSVVWILGEKFTYKNSLTTFQKVSLSSINKQLTLLHYDTKKKRLIVRNDFQLNSNEKMTCYKQVILKDKSLKFKQHPSVSRMNQPNIQKQHQKLLSLRSEQMLEFQQRLYQKNESLISMPKELYTVVPSEWMIQEFSYIWKYQLILWLESFPKHSIITRKRLIRWMQDIQYYELPQASSKLHLTPIIEFLEVLTQSGILKEMKKDQWSIQQKLKRYQFLEEKC